MTDTIYKNQVDLSKIIEKHSEQDGAHVTEESLSLRYFFCE